MNRIRNRRRQSGFTLIELLLVMVILVVLAGIVLPRFVGRGKQAKITAAKTDIGNISSALQAFEVDNQRFPTDEEGLAALSTQPSGLTEWHGPYLQAKKEGEAVPADPWGHPYVYHQPGTHHPEGFDLFSMGEDGREGNDDVTNWD